MTLDADLPIPSELEIEKEHLLLKLYDVKSTPKEFRFGLHNNKVISIYSFIFNSPANNLKRILFDKEYDDLKIEARCYGCSSFRYWSNNMVFNPKSYELEEVGINGERFKLVDKAGTTYIVSSSYKLKSTMVYVQAVEQKIPKTHFIPFISFKYLDFSKPREILRKIKTYLILS